MPSQALTDQVFHSSLGELGVRIEVTPDGECVVDVPFCLVPLIVPKGGTVVIRVGSPMPGVPVRLTVNRETSADAA